MKFISISKIDSKIVKNLQKMYGGNQILKWQKLC